MRKVGYRLTLEALAGAEPGTVIAQAPLPMKKVFSDVNRGAGYSLELTWPKGSETVPAGLYLCRDSANSGRCGDKTAADINAGLSSYNSEKPNFTVSEPGDRVYFFLPLFILPDGVSVPTQAFDAKRYKALGEYMAEVVPRSSDRESVVSKIKHINQILGSVPLKVGQRGVVLTLPGLDSNKCSRASSADSMRKH